MRAIDKMVEWLEKRMAENRFRREDYILRECLKEARRLAALANEREAEQEPLAVIMKKKGYQDMRVNVENKHYKWSIEFRGYAPYKEIVGETFTEAEAKARAYLMALEDKEGV